MGSLLVIAVVVTLCVESIKLGQAARESRRALAQLHATIHTHADRFAATDRAVAVRIEAWRAASHGIEREAAALDLAHAVQDAVMNGGDPTEAPADELRASERRLRSALLRYEESIVRWNTLASSLGGRFARTLGTAPDDRLAGQPGEWGPGEARR